MYIMAPEPISMVYIISLCAGMYIVAGQRLGIHVPAATNTCNNRKIVGRVFSIRYVSCQNKAGD
jgi:hypothetical protein